MNEVSIASHERTHTSQMHVYVCVCICVGGCTRAGIHIRGTVQLFGILRYEDNMSV